MSVAEMVAWRQRVKASPQRAGCRACDAVMHVEPRQTEDELHAQRCPTCGTVGLHEYPIRGTWPSEHVNGCPFQDEEP